MCSAPREPHEGTKPTDAAHDESKRPADAPQDGSPRPADAPHDGSPRPADAPHDGSPRPADAPHDGSPRPADAPQDGSPRPTDAAHDRRLPPALLALTATTGLVDAVSYLGLGHVFTANMTGNVVLLGFGLANAGGLPVVAPLVSLGAFLLGAGAGGRIAVRLSSRRSRHLGVALGIEAGLLGCSAVLAALAAVRIASPAAYAIIALVAFAMGVRNATVRRLAVPDLTTTVLTLTLTGLAADSRPAGGSSRNSRRRSGAVAAMLVGALVGALLEKQSLTLPLAVAVATVVWTLAVVVRARPRS